MSQYRTSDRSVRVTADLHFPKFALREHVQARDIRVTSHCNCIARLWYRRISLLSWASCAHIRRDLNWLIWEASDIVPRPLVCLGKEYLRAVAYRNRLW